MAEAGILNKLVISSDCLSGPVELFNKNNGYLFKSNSKEDLVKKFIEYKNTHLEEKQKKIIITKMKFKKYSLFDHFLKLKSFLL